MRAYVTGDGRIWLISSVVWLPPDESWAEADIQRPDLSNRSTLRTSSAMLRASMRSMIQAR